MEAVPAGPLAVRWHGAHVPEVRAGALSHVGVELENAGTLAWGRPPAEQVKLAYHWLDERGNPIHWDGLRTELAAPVAPGERVRVQARLRGPLPPGRYRLTWDLVDEGRLWFEELGSAPLAAAVEVRPRVRRRLAARGGDPAALAALEEALVPEQDADAVALLAPGAAPAPDWSRRVLDAHEEGYALVGGSIEVETGLLRRRSAALEPWRPGTGRVPGFAHPLLCASVVRGVEPVEAGEVEGLPALRAPEGEPWLYDGRIVVRARPRSGRRRG